MTPSMEVTLTKVVVLLLLGIIKLFSGLVPLTLSRYIKTNKNDWWIKKCIGEFLFLITWLHSH